jgi:hypothetical protein
VATLKQIEANRRNSQSSTGPRSAVGKAAVRFNALKSGIDAASQLIPGEDPDVFNSFAAEFTASCNPAGAREQELVDQMIDDAWRLRRLRKAETQQWTKSISRMEARSGEYPVETRLADACFNCEASLTHIQRMVASIKRSYRQTSADLDKLQAARARAAQQAGPEPEIAEQSQFEAKSIAGIEMAALNNGTEDRPADDRRPASPLIVSKQQEGSTADAFPSRADGVPIPPSAL